MAEPEQSRTTESATLELLKADIGRLVMALETLLPELTGIKVSLARIELTLNEIALGLGVPPR